MIRHLLTIMAVLILGIRAGFACSCIGQEDVEQAYRKADVVVLGTVIGVETLEVSYGLTIVPHFAMYVNRYTVRVEHLFKGRSVSGTVVVVTGLGGGDCGFLFEMDKRYVIYGDDNGSNKTRMYADKPLKGRGIYRTNICTRTRAYDDAEVRDLEGLKQRQLPPPRTK